MRMEFSSSERGSLAHARIRGRMTASALMFVVACAAVAGAEYFLGSKSAQANGTYAADTGPDPRLVQPDKQIIPKVRIADAVGWTGEQQPTTVPGFAVNALAKDLDHPRWIYVLPNGDVLVAETNAPQGRNNRKGIKGWFMKQAMKKAGAGTPTAERITLLRDADGDGVAELRAPFIIGLKSPFGIALVGKDLYVANTDAIVKFAYQDNATAIVGQGEKVVDLPAGDINHHWTKNIIASPDGNYLYATVGSNSNVAEHGMEAEHHRAAILQVDLQSKTTKLFASGLRNPNGLAWHPASRELWVAVNERDEIGDNLVPDYITSVREGEFFGWPYSYYGAHVDERVEPQDPGLVSKAKRPDYAVGSHVAALGLAFYDGGSRANAAFPQRYRGGAFVGLHGSWNRAEFNGYRVAFIPFDANGKPAGAIEDFLTGFLDDDKAMGRPVGVAFDKTGALLVADDVGNRVWRVTSMGNR